VSSGELNIILGCFGRTDDGFISCAGCENIILKLESSHYCYAEIMDYLDSLQLFDRALLNNNAIRHLIFNMQDRFASVSSKLWSEKMFLLYQKFTIDHRDCGLFVKLQLPVVGENNS